MINLSSMMAPRFNFDAPIQPQPEYIRFGGGAQQAMPQMQPQAQHAMPVEKIGMPQQAVGYNNAALQAPRMRLADLMGMYRAGI